ncbi:MAG: hypothetical protein HY000_19115 [Planctomycetes bacterium]|nr:hypothetical protein [Planctomycetota bacterium]
MLSATAPTVEVELAITGREVEFTPAGLPQRMAGDVYLNAAPTAHSDRPIGKYEEVLTPILADVNGDSLPDLVGTTGVSTFTFFVNSVFPKGLASVTTANVSYIQGVNAAGELLVNSVGTIIEGTGLAKRLSGGFTSTSVVGFYPSFSMHTEATFHLTGKAGKLLNTLTEVVSTLEHCAGDSDRHGWQMHQPAQDDAQHANPEGKVRSHDADQHLRAVDYVLDREIASILPIRGRHKQPDDTVADVPLAA